MWIIFSDNCPNAYLPHLVFQLLVIIYPLFQIEFLCKSSTNTSNKNIILPTDLIREIFKHVGYVTLAEINQYKKHFGFDDKMTNRIFTKISIDFTDKHVLHKIPRGTIALHIRLIGQADFQFWENLFKNMPQLVQYLSFDSMHKYDLFLFNTILHTVCPNIISVEHLQKYSLETDKYNSLPVPYYYNLPISDNRQIADKSVGTLLDDKRGIIDNRADRQKRITKDNFSILVKK
jgi:hypothetical protein